MSDGNLLEGMKVGAKGEGEDEATGMVAPGQGGEEVGGTAPGGTKNGESGKKDAGKAGGALGPQVPPPFLTKLYDLVDDIKTNDLVSWSPDGNIFTVHKTTLFERDVLPKYFKHNNFSSFVRQLNQYGFHKQDPDNWTFGHENFRRGRKDLLGEISRKKSRNQIHTSPNSNLIQVIPGRDSNANSQKLILELGNYGGILGEVDRLQRDRELLLKELVGTRKQLGMHRKNENQLKQKCEMHERRIEQLETNMKKMQQFLYYYFQPVLKNYGKSKRKRLPAPMPANGGESSGSAMFEEFIPQGPTLERTKQIDSDSFRRMVESVSSGGGAAANGFVTDGTPLVEEPSSASREGENISVGTPILPVTPSFPPAYVQEISAGDAVQSTASGSENVQAAPTTPTALVKRRRTGERTVSSNVMDDGQSPMLNGIDNSVLIPSETIVGNADNDFAPPTPNPPPNLNSPSFQNGAQLAYQPTENGFETMVFQDAAPEEWQGYGNKKEGNNGEGEDLQNFLDLEDVSESFPPLHSLPQGTDVDAFAQRMDDFQEATY